MSSPTGLGGGSGLVGKNELGVGSDSDRMDAGMRLGGKKGLTAHQRMLEPQNGRRDCMMFGFTLTLG